jgi:hypothetical protein
MKKAVVQARQLPQQFFKAYERRLVNDTVPEVCSNCKIPGILLTVLYSRKKGITRVNASANTSLRGGRREASTAPAVLVERPAASSSPAHSASSSEALTSRIVSTLLKMAAMDSSGRMGLLERASLQRAEREAQMMACW